MVPIIRVLGGVIVKEIPAITKYAGQRTLPSVVRGVEKSSSVAIRNAVGRRTRATMAASLKGATTSPAAKGWLRRTVDRMPNWLKKAGMFAGELVAFDQLLDLMDDDKAAGNDESQTTESEENALTNILIANGHSKLLENIENIPEHEDMTSSRLDDLVDLVGDIFTSRAAIAGSDMSYSKTSRLEMLSNNERILIITRLVNVIKQVSVTAVDNEIMLLAANQAMVSGMMNAAPTNAFDILINSNSVDRRKANAKAAELNSMFTALGDELAESAYDDFFAQHSSVLDFFDLIKYSGDEEIEGEDASIAARLARLVTDDSAGAALNILQRFTVDSDGEDDESRALNRTIEYGRLSNPFLDFVIAGSFRNSQAMERYLSQ